LVFKNVLIIFKIKILASTSAAFKAMLTYIACEAIEECRKSCKI
jgi:hypothetical protein